MIADPQIPQAPDSERAIIGALLLNPCLITDVRKRLRPEQFYLDSHREPYAALLALAERGAAIDPLQLAEELRERGTLDKVGGLAIISEQFIGGLPSQIESHVQRVTETFHKRKLWRVASRAAEAANNGAGAAEIVKELRAVIAEVEAGAAAHWPEPKPLPSGLQPVPVLPDAVIPQPLRPWLADIAERLQVPLDFPAVAAVVCLAAVIGNQVRLRPKRRDDWTVTANLWGAIVGRPGVMKSPAIAEAMKPLRRLVKAAEQTHKEACAAWQFDKEAAEARRSATRARMKKAADKGNDLEKFRAELAEAEAEEPKERRYIVNDTTVEKYGELLNENSRGLLIFRDELTGWLRSLDDERRASDRAFYLEAWNGDGSFTYDRIGRGTLKIHHTTTSILGGIQPGPLESYLRNALGYGEGDDGLMQRFQMIIYPDIGGEWENVDRWPETTARNRAFAIFQKLSELDAKTLGAEDDKPEPDEQTESDETEPDEADRKPFLHFTADAQALFDEWFCDLNRSLRAGEFEHPALEAHFAKYKSLMPSLALIFHLCDMANNEAAGAVSLDAAKMAAAWCSFLMAHAKRIYGLGIGAAAIHARTLALHLKKGDLPDGFTARDLWRHGWAGLAKPSEVSEPLDVLEGLGWLSASELRGAGGGRPTVLYAINPRIQEAKL